LKLFLSNLLYNFKNFITLQTLSALTLNATAPENNPMTYAWEQMYGVKENVITPPASTNDSEYFHPQLPQSGFFSFG
jgi:hypothetical protein